MMFCSIWVLQTSHLGYTVNWVALTPLVGNLIDFLCMHFVSSYTGNKSLKRWDNRAAAGVAHLPDKHLFSSFFSVRSSLWIWCPFQVDMINETRPLHAVRHHMSLAVCEIIQSKRWEMDSAGGLLYQTLRPSPFLWNTHPCILTCSHAGAQKCILIHVHSPLLFSKQQSRYSKIWWHSLVAGEWYAPAQNPRYMYMQAAASACLEDVWKMAHAACRVAACLH